MQTMSFSRSRSLLAFVVLGIAVLVAGARAAYADECSGGICIPSGGVEVPGSDIPGSEIPTDGTVHDGVPAPKYDHSPGYRDGANIGKVKVTDVADHLVPKRAVPPGTASTWGDATGKSLLERLLLRALDLFNEGYTIGQETGENLPDVEVEVLFGPVYPVGQGYPNDGSAQPGEKLSGAVAESDPVNPATGELVYERTDLSFPGFGVPFLLSRTYRSRTHFDGPLGHGWDHTLNQRLVFESDEGDAVPTVAVFMTGEATAIRFRRSRYEEKPVPGTFATRVETEFVGPPSVPLTLRGVRERIGDRSEGNTHTTPWQFSLTAADGIVRTFDEAGLLRRMEDPNGQGLALTWERSPRRDAWRVKQVVDSVGRRIDFLYDRTGYLREVVEPKSGLGASYVVAAPGHLQWAQDAQGKREAYEYDYDPAREEVVATYLPEPMLRQACELACAPTGSHPDAGGGCDPALTAAQQCASACTSCESQCASECGQACRQGCLRGDPGSGFLGCSGGCQSLCDSRKQEICDTQWRTQGESACRACGSRCAQSCDDGWCDGLAFCLGGTFDGTDVGANRRDTAAACASFEEQFWHSLTSAFELGWGAFRDLVGCLFSWTPWTECDWDDVRAQWFEACASTCEKCCAFGDCPTGSCQKGKSCFDECRAGFWGDPVAYAGGLQCNRLPDEEYGCRFHAYASCATRCDEECVGRCAPGCETQCATSCKDACNVPRCLATCDTVQFLEQCQAGCVDGCIDAAHAGDPTFAGARYGHVRDLNHNLLRIRDGHGEVFLENVYGADVADPSFDAVIRQVRGDAPLSFAYRDLGGEARGDTPIATTVEASLVVGREDFETVDICPSVCAGSNDQAAPARGEFVPWDDGILIDVSSFGTVAGGFPLTDVATRPGRSIPPLVLRLSKLGAKLLVRAPDGGDALDGATFRILSIDGSALFVCRREEREVDPEPPLPPDAPPGRPRLDAPIGGGGGVHPLFRRGPIRPPRPLRDAILCEVTANAGAIDYLAALGEITVLHDAARVLRVYPRRPNGLHLVSSGSCSRPFMAERNSVGQIQLAPQDSCSREFVVAPLASAVAAGTVPTSTDTFQPTVLVPRRYAFSWREVPLLRGRYEPSVGPGGGAAPPSLLGAVIRIVNLGPLLPTLSASAQPQAMTTAPTPQTSLFVFHVTDALAASLHHPWLAKILEVGPLFERVAEDACAARIPAEPRRGAHENAPGPKPDRAAVVTDPFGVVWTFYYDRQGRELRRVNHGTGAVTSYDYRGGDLAGIEDPLRGRACFTWTKDGFLEEKLVFPVPGADGPKTPIRERYSYTGFPVRLERVFDPRDPTKVLVTYGWDPRGNLVSATHATGDVTRFVPGPHGLPTRSERADGSRMEWLYDTTAAVVETTILDAGGASPVRTTVKHDLAGRPIEERGPLGAKRTTSWEGGVVRATAVEADPWRESVAYHYDADRELEEVRGARTASRFKYDRLGHVQSTVVRALTEDLAPIATCTLRGVDGRLLEAVGPEGERVRYAYDGEGRVLRVVAGTWAPSAESWDDECPTATDGHRSYTLVAVGYDRAGRVEWVEGARGERTSFVHDGFGRPIRVTDPAGTVYRADYDALGNPIWQAAYAPGSAVPDRPPQRGDPGLLAATELEYDPIGRLARELRWHFDETGAPVGDGVAATAYAYGPGGRWIRVTDDAGHSTLQEFDGAGRPVRTVHPTGDDRVLEYRDGGRTVREMSRAPTPSGVLGTVVRLTPWGAAARVEADGAGGAVLERRDYDSFGQLASAAGAAGQATSWAFDAFGRVARVLRQFDAGSYEELRFVYDRAGRVRFRTSIAGAGGTEQTYAFDYDALGRPVAQVRPDGTWETYAYEGAGTLVSAVRDSRDVVLTLTRDGRGAVTQARTATPPGSALAPQLRTFEHDGLGRLVGAREGGLALGSTADDVVTQFRWDSLGNKTAEWDSNLGSARGVRHAYDGRGLAVASSYGTVGVRRSFDPLGRLQDLWLGTAATSAVHFDYAGIGGPVGRRLGNGVQTTYGYDVLGRREAQTDTRGGAPLASWRWELPLDGVPRLSAHRAGGGGEVASLFRVDPAGRVLEERHGLDGAAVSGFTLSPTASFREASGAVASFGASASARSWRGYGYDGRHNWQWRNASDATLQATTTVSLLDQYDSLGAEAPVYDVGGALVEVGPDRYAYDSFGALTGAARGSDRRRYVYDALGRLVREIDPTTQAETRYGYDGLRRVLRRVPSGRFDVTIEGDGLDEHLVNVDATTGRRLYFHQERTNSVYLVTDDAGNAAEWYTYTAFGEPTIRDAGGAILPASALGNRFGFQGQPFDARLGLVDMRARFYRPAWGRFLSPDPIGLAGGSNLFAFVSGAPLRFWDPLGLDGKAVTGTSDAGSLVPDTMTYDEVGDRMAYAFPTPEDVTPPPGFVKSGYSVVRADGSVFHAWNRAGEPAIDYFEINGVAFLRTPRGFFIRDRAGQTASVNEWWWDWTLALQRSLQRHPDEWARALKVMDGFETIAGGYLTAADTATTVVGLWQAARATVGLVNSVRGAAGAGGTALSTEAAALSGAAGGARRATTGFIDDVTVVSHGKVIGRGTVDVRATVEGIQSGKLSPRAIFENREGLLPRQAPGYYQEFVHPTPGVSGVGPQRIVRGQGGEL